MDKEIIATLEIADREVRLIVGQFFNGRLNILKVERVAHYGVSGYSIMSEKHVIDSLKKAIENASRNLGVIIESVILLVPGVHVKRLNRQLHVPITGRINEVDVRRAYSELRAMQAPQDYVLTNIMFSKFFLNGSSTRKLPLNERTESLTIEAECYYSKQSIIFPYVSVAEKAGLKIIDIVVDDIGFGKEATLFEASIDKPVVGVTLGEKYTKLSLFYRGILLSNDYVEDGFSRFLKSIETSYKVPADVVNRLLYFDVDLDNKIVSDDPIFMWSTKSQTHTLSQNQLSELVNQDIRDFLSYIVERCEPIFKLGDPRFVITGEASTIGGLDTYIANKHDVETEAYRSTTFGTKDPALTSVLGAFYFYKDQAIYRNETKSSINESEFKSIVLQYDKDEKDDSITQKLKNMFFER